MMKLFSIILHKILSPLLSFIKLRWFYFIYRRRLPSIVERIRNKEKIKVVFFPINIGMWKNDYLFERLLADPRFKPYVISFFVPVDSIDFQLRNQEEMRSYFVRKGYPYFDMYNFDTNQWTCVV